MEKKIFIVCENKGSFKAGILATEDEVLRYDLKAIRLESKDIPKSFLEIHSQATTLFDRGGKK